MLLVFQKTERGEGIVKKGTSIGIERQIAVALLTAFSLLMSTGIEKRVA